MYFHVVVTFAGSKDPIKVTNYTQAEHDLYVQGLPSDAIIHYNGDCPNTMRIAFNAARLAHTPTELHIAESIAHRAVIRAAQRVCEPHEIHTRAQIQAIIDAARN